MSTIRIEDNTNLVKEEFERRIPIVLEALGIEIEGNAVSEITELGAVDTGRLRGSITHATDSDEVRVGTNVEYAPYVELGTYKMAARPFLQNAVNNHLDDYKRIVEEGFK